MPHLVARIGKPHALRGEVTVQLHTDAPEERFVVGATLDTDPADRGPLTVRSMRVHQGITLLGFEEAADRTAAEALRGTRLYVDEGAGVADAGDDEGWYAEELEGLEVRDAGGVVIGRVTGLLTRPVQDLLEVELPDGREALLPFVDEIVPEVDIEGGYVVATPPPGLLDLDRDDA